MSEDSTSIQEAADAAVEAVLEGGQSVSVDGVSRTRAGLRDAYSIAQDERERVSRASGRRPLFRNMNLSGVQ